MTQDPMENFNHCARRYATNKGKSRTTAGRQLLLRMYVWALRKYVGGEAHWLHSPRASRTGEGRMKRSTFHQGSTNEDTEST